MGGPGGDADEALFVAARTEPSAFGDFFARRHGRVRAFLLRRTRCPHAAEDLTSETFAEAWATLERYDPARGAPLAWVLGIARNLHRRWLRHRQATTSAFGRAGTADRTDDDLERVDRMVDAGTARASIAAALSGLSPTVHDAVVLRILGELPYDEVAPRLGCSRGAARTRVARGLARLAAELDGPC